MDRDNEMVEAALAGFDGRRVAPLKAISQRALSPGAIETLLDNVPGENEIGATWVFKALAEANFLPDRACTHTFAALPRLSEPDAILHVLQMVQYAPEVARDQVEAFRRLLGHRRTLVRVWAMDAAVRTAVPEEAERLIRAGLADPSKAMLARARRLARELTIEGF